MGFINHGSTLPTPKPLNLQNGSTGPREDGLNGMSSGSAKQELKALGLGLGFWDFGVLIFPFPGSQQS